MGHPHVGVICDECSESPIIGTRYSSKVLYGFDLCEYCYRSSSSSSSSLQNATTRQEGQERLDDEFTAINEPLSFREEISMGVAGRHRRDNQINASTVAQAKEQLQIMVQEDDDGDGDVGPPSHHVAYFHFFERTCPAKAEQNATEVLGFLEDHPELTNLRFTIPFDRTVPYGGIVEILATGFINNNKRLSHIKQIDWSISGNWHSDDADFPAASSIAALGDLIAQNTTLKGIFIHVPCQAEDAMNLIRPLASNKTLTNFRLAVRHHDNVISNENLRNTALRLLEDHPSLKKVFLDGRYNPKDQENACFQQDLKLSNISRISGWNTRWCHPNLSDRERVQTIQEIESASSAFSPPSSLTCLYQVIRRNPQIWQGRS